MWQPWMCTVLQATVFASVESFQKFKQVHRMCGEVSQETSKTRQPEAVWSLFLCCLVNPRPHSPLDKELVSMTDAVLRPSC